MLPGRRSGTGRETTHPALKQIPPDKRTSLECNCILDAMDAFESLVAMLLERKGYWIRSGVKVELTKEEKRQIGRPSSPRWELDLVAYKGSSNSLLVVECKSFLDSRGVSAAAFAGPDQNRPDRYKLFTDSVLRSVVLGQLQTQLVEAGFCRPSPKTTLCLVAGRVAGEQDRKVLRSYFKEKGWQFWDDEWLRASLGDLPESGYENNVAAVVAKLLLRKR